jgi:hypothetical protein
MNSNQPPESKLPRGDRDVMEEFIENVRILIGTLGYKFLEPLLKSKIVELDLSSHLDDPPSYLKLKSNKFKATAIQTDEGLVVLKDSQGALVATGSLSAGYAKIREQLIEKGKIELSDDVAILKEDILFKSLSHASATLLGYPSSGPEYWINENGISLKELELNIGLGSK